MPSLYPEAPSVMDLLVALAKRVDALEKKFSKK